MERFEDRRVEMDVGGWDDGRNDVSERERRRVWLLVCERRVYGIGSGIRV